MSYTTIQISQETREKLSKLKASERETYDEILNSLMDLIPSGDDEGEYTEEFKASLMRAIADVKRGRVYSMKDVRKEIGV